MYLYRKPKTQRQCSKPATEKQKLQRELAFLLFRLGGARMNYPSRSAATEHMYQEIAHLNEAVKALTETVKERLRNL